jgi:chromosome segregation ATPase
MTPDPRAPRDNRIDAGLLEPPSEEHGKWATDEVQEASRRIQALTREIAVLENGLKAQRDEIARLSEALQTVEGRTLRHEAGQDVAREVSHEIAQLDERIEAEAALRRELAGGLDRLQQRENQVQQELQRVLGVISERLDQFDGRQASVAERQSALVREVAEHDREDQDVEGRLDQMERHLEALREADRHAGAEVARMASAVAPLLTAIEGLESRTRTIQADQRRIDDEVAVLRSVPDREEALLEVIEQQRATRARLEDRVSQIEEEVETLRQQESTEHEEIRLLQRQLAGEVEQRRVLAERLEAQRDAFVEHLRRQARAEEERARRQIEDLEREVRVKRQLAVRLQEDSEEVSQEHPL